MQQEKDSLAQIIQHVCVCLCVLLDGSFGSFFFLSLFCLLYVRYLLIIFLFFLSSLFRLFICLLYKIYIYYIIC